MRPHTSQDFPNSIDYWGEQFGQNEQKLYENYKIGIFGSRKWGEDKPIFRVVGNPPSPSPTTTRRNPASRGMKNMQITQK